MLHCNKNRVTLAAHANSAKSDGRPSAPDRDKALDFPHLCRPFDRGGIERALSQEPAQGQTGLSVAFDLPTQTGYDIDHPLAKGEVGKVGVPICHLGDMRALFDGIPLGEMNTSMTINATAAWLLALYIALADEQGAPRTSSRHHPERHHQGISLARHLCVPAGAVDAADQGRDPLHDQARCRSGIR